MNMSEKSNMGSDPFYEKESTVWSHNKKTFHGDAENEDVIQWALTKLEIMPNLNTENVLQKNTMDQTVSRTDLSSRGSWETRCSSRANGSL